MSKSISYIICILILIGWWMFAKFTIGIQNTQESQKIEVTQTADVVPDLSIPEFVLNDTSIALLSEGVIRDFGACEAECVIFSYDDGDLMRFNLKTGDIYWKEKLVITDKELVEGLRNIIQENRCPECKKLRSYNE